MTPPPIRSTARLRIAVDYAVLRADVRERFTFAAVAPCAHTSPRSPRAARRRHLFTDEDTMTDRIAIATDMARERLAEAGLGNGKLAAPTERPGGDVDMLAVLTVSAHDIDAQIDLERERGVERKTEDARPVRDERLSDKELTSLEGSYCGAFDAQVIRACSELRDSRAAIARVEALVGTLRATLGLCEARHIEAALRGERSGQ